MFDARSEAHEFVGLDRGDAVNQATRFFGVDESALEVAELAAENVNGLGGRTVVVAALRDRPPMQQRRQREDRGSRGERGDRGGRDRGGRDRGERGGGREGRGGRGERSPAPERAREPDLELEDVGPSVGTVKGASLAPIGEFVKGLIEKLEIGPFEISESEEGTLLAYEIAGSAARRLAAGDGRPVDALQLIANQAATQEDPDAKRVVLDIEGNADAREDFLGRLADRVVKRARDGGRAVALDPMNGRDRRMIHLAVRDIDDVVTISKGEGRYRQVVVVPEGAPEYEEARREADAAAERSEG